MDSISNLPRPIGSGPLSPSHHKPLQRVLPSKIIPPTEELTAAHPLLFTQKKQSSTKINACATSSDASTGDSCYSSCSEESHASLSRESSDSATRNEFQIEIDEKLLEFATKLGFSETNLKIVLEKLGPDAEKNNVLEELIRLGKSSTNSSTRKKFDIQQQILLENVQPKLRSIVIDGSNIAMTHGHKEFFSCKGIQECVNFFIKRGHDEIFVFVPQFRKEAPRSDCPITDQHILFELELEKKLIWTPARRVNGRRIVCHDDRYILKTAEEKDAVIVSNDEYRDLIKENSQYRTLVEQRLLMYSFVDGKFMPPDDPLGRRGPTLDQFLSYGPSAANAQLCPYAKKCTYGNKCKYYHPERKNGVKQTATERLTNGCKGKQNLKERPSMIYEGCATRNNYPSQYYPMSSISVNNRNQVGRTQSLNVNFNQQQLFQQHPMYSNNSFAPNHSPHPMSSNMNMGNVWNSIPHHPLNRNYSSPLKNNFDSMISPNFIQQIKNDSRSNSLNDFHSSTSFTMSTSTNIWGESIFPMSNQKSINYLQYSDDQRIKLQYHLCQLFPESTVLAVMSAHPDETDAQKLCQMIIAFQKGFD